MTREDAVFALLAVMWHVLVAGLWLPLALIALLVVIGVVLDRPTSTFSKES
ncbi:hypothetical protein P5P86_11920 [Nocardioides sp. BP30]|uniref:hypothetical protein n=1 Tax=Nocardioides sp. BP30 TaxID=3036374 RepID=UPI0024686D89|nr:hypothetical protein [Nocardioides sp. BP30]WGL50671.1 hypothetical protein P5P86_11920 [Nocardioides sp. BP30]